MTFAFSRLKEIVFVLETCLDLSARSGELCSSSFCSHLNKCFLPPLGFVFFLVFRTAHWKGLYKSEKLMQDIWIILCVPVLVICHLRMILIPAGMMSLFFQMLK